MTILDMALYAIVGVVVVVGVVGFIIAAFRDDDK